jgi:hypothetical protein
MRISVPASRVPMLRAAADAHGVSMATALRNAILSRCGIDPSSVPVANHPALVKAAMAPRATLSSVSLGCSSAVTVRPRVNPARFDAFIAEDRDSRWPYPSAARMAADTSPPQVSGTAP